MTPVKAVVQPNEINPMELGNLEDLQVEFREYLAENNYQRARGALMLVMLFAVALFVYDYTSIREEWRDTQPWYELLLLWHGILAAGTAVLLLVAFFIRNKNSWIKAGFLLCTCFFMLCQVAFINGNSLWQLEAQITGYFLVVCGIVVLFYIRPLGTFLVYFFSYPIFILGLRDFNLEGPWITSTLIYGFIFVIIAWLLSIKMYNYQFQVYKQRKLLDKISEQRIATLEANLNINKEITYRLATIVETTNDGVISMTLEGIITYWNPGAERIYGYREDEVIGKSIYMIVPEEILSDVKEIYASALAGEQLTNYETRAITKDSRVVEVSLTISTIKDIQGEVLGMSCIVRDISEQKRVERELIRLDRLNLIGELAASISHEVRNPMATVRGFLQLLQKKKGCQDYGSYFELMIEELDRANGILTEFLSISRNKATERSCRSLNEIITSLLPLIEANAVADDKKVKVELQELPKIMMDDKEIRQVILNLSRNGIEAMEAGGVLTLRTAYMEEQVVLEVEDQGCGISQGVIEHLGTPFYTTKSNGTGIGLTICYGIAARHNAKIDVESSTKGTIFRISFPVHSC